jgi:ribulose-phosphate 3-epimerase
MIELGIKSDAIEYRYSFEWLFDLMAEHGIKYMQLGSFFEMYSLDDDYFYNLKEKATERGLQIKSTFTAHRELGGFFVGDLYMEKVARKNFEKFITIASILGADYCGSNPGAVYRDKFYQKDDGISCYLSHMKELQHLAYERGLKGLTMEPMSCMAEPPTTPQEMSYMIGTLNEYHKKNILNTVPFYLCGDISHGLANESQQVIHSNMELFVHAIPMMAEFHFKNTDAIFSSTFGFSDEEKQRGIVNLQDVKKIIETHLELFPVKNPIGYLEISGPKTGRDYSDRLLRKSLSESLLALKKVFEK